MNIRNRRLRRTLAAAAAAAGIAALALTIAGTADASAQRGVARAQTNSYHHPDTTSVSGPATVSTPDGPVWAYDNLHFTLTSVRTGPGTYAVEIDAHGTWDAFANPRTGAAYVHEGRVSGWYDLSVSSPTAPNRLYVPVLEPGSMSQSAIVQQFFGGAATSVVGGHYGYSYGKIDGANYTQTG